MARRRRGAATAAAAAAVPPPPTLASTVRSLNRPSIPAVLAGGALYAAATAAGWVFWQVQTTPACGSGCEAEGAVSEAARRSAYTAGAASYDEDVGLHERLGGIARLRERLIQHARGDTLEVAAGTGRNLEHYPEGCRVVLTDACDAMLGVARRRAAELGAGAAGSVAGCARFVRSDAERLESAAELGGVARYDAVVDTFGLCSFGDPAAALRQMAIMLKPGGRLLLLEHGRSPVGWLSTLLDRYAERHAAKWGCWWNRDVNALVAQLEAEQLIVVDTRARFHAGTTLYVEATRV